MTEWHVAWAACRPWRLVACGAEVLALSGTVSTVLSASQLLLVCHIHSLGLEAVGVSACCLQVTLAHLWTSTPSQGPGFQT